MGHTHRYTRTNIGRDKEYWVMKCNLPDCTHYVAGKTKLSFPLLRGQTAICNKCAEPFTLNRRALRMANPVCDDCVNRKEAPKEKAKDLDAFFDSLMEEVKK